MDIDAVLKALVELQAAEIAALRARLAALGALLAAREARIDQVPHGLRH